MTSVRPIAGILKSAFTVVICTGLKFDATDAMKTSPGVSEVCLTKPNVVPVLVTTLIACASPSTQGYGRLIHAVAPDLTLYGIALAYANHHIKHGT